MPLAHFGGPSKAALPSTSAGSFYDPLAPFDLTNPSETSGSGESSNGINIGSVSPPPPSGWFYATDYNAVYGQMTNVSGKFLQVRQDTVL